MNKRMTCKNPECPRPSEMKPFELDTHWAFVCPTCNSAQVWDKRRADIGGTLGAGQKADGRRLVVGKGF